MTVREAERAACVADLEAAVDALGLAAVVECLAEVCAVKAEHVRLAWQDERTARPWDRARRRLEAAAVKLASA
jgi:hypothetical protein